MVDMKKTEWDVPAVSTLKCGNYKDHSLFSAKTYAHIVLDAGISDDPFRS